MPRVLSKLRFWSHKSCQACKGQPTPPPCYNCTLKVETPPPAFASLGGGHFFGEDEDQESCLYPFEEEYTYPEDAQMGVEFRKECQLENVDSEDVYEGRTALFDLEAPGSDYMGYDLPRALSNVALAFLPDDQRPQVQAQRTRHPTAPVSSSNLLHDGISRTISASKLSYLENSTYEDDRETVTSSNRSLLAALNLPILQMEDQLSVPEPVSPRSVSPLPSQLLIPE